MAVPERPLDLRPAGARLPEQHDERPPRLDAQSIHVQPVPRPRQQGCRTATLTEDRRLHGTITGVAMLSQLDTLPFWGLTP
jgi:hypothetical protein